MLRSDHWSKVESKCKKELDKELGRRSNKLTALGCYKLRNLEKILKAKGMAPLTLDDIEPYRIHLFDR